MPRSDAERARAYRARKGAKPKPPPAPHGTVQAAKRHLRDPEGHGRLADCDATLEVTWAGEATQMTCAAAWRIYDAANRRRRRARGQLAEVEGDGQEANARRAELEAVIAAASDEIDAVRSLGAPTD